MHRVAGTAAIAILAAAIAAGPAQAQMTPHERGLYEAARKEGEVTWYVAQVATEPAERVANVFTTKYPGVKVNSLRASAQVIYQRLSSDIKAGTPQCDVFSSTDIGHDVELKQRRLLMKYVPENAAHVLDAYKNLDPDGYFHTTVPNYVVLAYRSDRLKPAEAPQRWSDLTDPKWNKQVALGHPAYSGVIGGWVVMMEKMYGWKYFETLAKNGAHVGRSIQDVGNMIVTGERLAGPSVAGTVERLRGRGQPIDAIYPEDGAQLFVSASAIMASAPHPNAGKLLMEFLLSREGSAAVVKEGYETVRPDVAPSPGAKAPGTFKAITLSLEETHRAVGDVKEKWRETFGN